MGSYSSQYVQDRARSAVFNGVRPMPRKRARGPGAKSNHKQRENMRKALRMVLAAVAVTTLLAGGLSSAQAASAGPGGFPKKDISVVVSFAAGGGTDVTARGFLKTAEKYIDAKFLVSNITGATGWNGWMQSLAAPKDGYNLTVLSINLFMESGTGKSYKDFVPLAAMSVYPTVIAVPASSDIKTLDDLIKTAKANPDTLRWGLDGLRGVDHVNSVKFAETAGFKVKYVPFKGGAETIAAALGNNIDVFTANTPETAGRDDIRTLALMSEERLPHMADVPTMKELGYDIVVTRFRILGTQAGVPADILAYLDGVFQKTSADPEWLAFANSIKAEPYSMNMAQCIEYLDKMNDVVSPIFQKK